MDFLPMALSAICQRVDRITVSRVQDASIRRIPFQEKIGAGLTLEEFREKEKAGVLRHIGLTESIHMIADRLGWALDETTETLQPVIARRRLTTGYAPIERGMASGVEQIGRGFSGGKEVVTLEFRAAIGEPESFDRIEVSGEPTFVSSITGGINGDVATCAITINALFSIVRCAPGLKTMIDVPVPAFRRGEGFIG
jgi:4-hydroxy-tetrahydrodipicolinate reductase